MPPAPARLAFQLSAADVAAGVRERTNAAAATSALHEIRSTPLLAKRTIGAGDAAAAAAAARISMRFGVGDASASASASAASSRQASPVNPALAGGPLTFATMVGTRPRCAVPDCDDPRHAHHLAAPTATPTATPVTTLYGNDCAKIVNGTCADQYSVRPRSKKSFCPRMIEVMHGVLIANELDLQCPAQKGSISALLGPTGHVERAAAWTHIAGGGLFLAYAVGRMYLADAESPAGIAASVAAWGVVVTMVSSSFYHATAPDMKISLIGRFLDYSSIYFGIVTTAFADIAIATNSFKNVPLIAAVDIPVAGAVVFAFFLWRRTRIPARVTWNEDKSRVFRDACPLGRGLFKMQHFDLHHSQLRYATSILLTAGYFAFAPAAFATFSIPNIAVILGLQAAGFLVLSFGMYVDRVLMWPDVSLAAAADTEILPACTQCASCGCVMTAHALWHIVAILSIALTCFAREYALLALPD